MRGGVRAAEWQRYGSLAGERGEVAVSRKREKKVEYKDEEIFELFPKFTYTVEEKKRLVLFHGYGRNLRKVIGYAENFDEPNKVCLVYLVGDVADGAVEKALEANDCTDRVWVLTAGFSAEQFRVWKEYDELRKQRVGIGDWDKEKDAPSEMWWEDREKYKRYYGSYAEDSGIMDGQVGMLGAEDRDFAKERMEEYEREERVIREYERLKERSRVIFREWRLHRRGRLEKPFRHERLGELLKKQFPCGAEAMGVNRYAFVTTASIDGAVKWSKSGEYDKRLGLTEEMTAAAVKALSGVIAREIAEKGYVKLSEIEEVATAPPYGLGYDGFSAACVVKALMKFSNRTLIYFDGCGHFAVGDDEQAEVPWQTIYESIYSPVRRKRRYDMACLYLESHPHKVVKKFMAKLWGVKVEMPGAWMGVHLGTKLCEEHRVPLNYIDERLLRCTLWNVDFWDKDAVSELASEIEKNGAEIVLAYKRYLSENAAVPERARSLLRSDYSWMWSAEEYERILRETEKYGPWPWSDEIIKAVTADRGGTY